MSERKGLFSNLFGRKKSSSCCNMEIIEEVQESCSCSERAYGVNKENIPIVESAISIKILGSGCKNCVLLADNAKQAVSQMGLQANIEKVTDLSAIAGYGVMSTPALVVDEKVVSFGKVLKSNEIIGILEKVVQ